MTLMASIMLATLDGILASSNRWQQGLSGSLAALELSQRSILDFQSVGITVLLLLRNTYQILLHKFRSNNTTLACHYQFVCGELKLNRYSTNLSQFLCGVRQFALFTNVVGIVYC